jgi:hypothetical protein
MTSLAVGLVKRFLKDPENNDISRAGSSSIGIANPTSIQNPTGIGKPTGGVITNSNIADKSLGDNSRGGSTISPSPFSLSPTKIPFQQQQKQQQKQQGRLLLDAKHDKKDVIDEQWRDEKKEVAMIHVQAPVPVQGPVQGKLPQLLMIRTEQVKKMAQCLQAMHDASEDLAPDRMITWLPDGMLMTIHHEIEGRFHELRLHKNFFTQYNVASPGRKTVVHFKGFVDKFVNHKSIKCAQITNSDDGNLEFLPLSDGDALQKKKEKQKNSSLVFPGKKEGTETAEIKLAEAEETRPEQKQDQNQEQNQEQEQEQETGQVKERVHPKSFVIPTLKIIDSTNVQSTILLQRSVYADYPFAMKTSTAQLMHLFKRHTKKNSASLSFTRIRFSAKTMILSITGGSPVREECFHIETDNILRHPKAPTPESRIIHSSASPHHPLSSFPASSKSIPKHDSNKSQKADKKKKSASNKRSTNIAGMVIPATTPLVLKDLDSQGEEALDLGIRQQQKDERDRSLKEESTTTTTELVSSSSSSSSAAVAFSDFVYEEFFLPKSLFASLSRESAKISEYVDMYMASGKLLAFRCEVERPASYFMSWIPALKAKPIRIECISSNETISTPAIPTTAIITKRVNKRKPSTVGLPTTVGDPTIEAQVEVVSSSQPPDTKRIRV